jgi:hypothetical protein
MARELLVSYLSSAARDIQIRHAGSLDSAAD